jgi:hypothetical protein
VCLRKSGVANNNGLLQLLHIFILISGANTVKLELNINIIYNKAKQVNYTCGSSGGGYQIFKVKVLNIKRHMNDVVNQIKKRTKPKVRFAYE